MKIEKEILEKIEWGDLTKISRQSGISVNTLCTAIKKKECSRKTFVAINFYLKNFEHENFKTKDTGVCP